MAEPHALYFPTGDGLIGLNWSSLPPGGASMFEFIDKSPFIRDTRDFIQHTVAGGGTGADRALFRFTFPYFTSYADGETAPQLASIGPGGARLSIYARGRWKSGDIAMNWIMRRSGVVTVISAFTILTGVGTFGVDQADWGFYTVTVANDPVTSAPWTLDNLVATQFGFEKTGATGNTTQIASLGLQVDEQFNPGEVRARLREAIGEPAMFCAICSLPFPRSALTLVVDPDHPHVGRLVCDADYDDYYPPDEPPALIEGDIDHEQR